MARITLLKLAAVCLISTTVPSATALTAAIYAAEVVGLLPRDNSGCVNSTYSACNKPGLPSNFCCPSGQTCYTFNNDKSVICCPAGKDCSAISTISCDLSQQNITAHPTSPLFTTDLTGTLTTCGSQCCPNGMKCSNNQCVASAPAASSQNPSAASSTMSAAATSTAGASPTAPTNTAGNLPITASSTPEASITPSPHCNPFPAASILVGFFSGLAAGIILAVLLICCFGHRLYRDDRSSSDFSSVTANVSDPIYHDAGGRSDFLRRESKSKYTNRTSRVRSLFSRTPTMRSRNSPVDGIGRSITGRSGPAPKTPVHQRSPETLRKEPSMESIKIYSPPNGGLDRPNTTFTGMMAEAGFKHGEPYLGSPGRVDPRSRGIGGV